MLFHISPLLCLHDLAPSSGWHSKVGKTDFWGVKNIDIWTGSKFATQIWEAVFYCDWWSLFRKSILLTFEPVQKVRGRMWPIVTPEKQTNTRNVAFKNETNRPVDWLRYWLSAMLRYHSKTDEYNIQKQTRISASVATSQQLEARECWERSRFWPYALPIGKNDSYRSTSRCAGQNVRIC